MKRLKAACRMGVLAGAMLWAGCSTAPKEAEPDSPALVILKEMGDALSAAKSFSLDASTAMDQSDEHGRTVRLSRRSRILMSRPDCLFASASGDDGEFALWYKGTNLTILARGRKAYATVTVPKTVDEMLDFAMDEHGLSVPLADLLFADPYAVLTAAVETATLLGREEVGGRAADHLLFTQANVDWEMWVDAGDVPVPLKVVITHKGQPGSPQFSATLSKWNLAADCAAGTFDFRPPEGAKKVSMGEILGGE